MVRVRRRREGVFLILKRLVSRFLLLLGIGFIVFLVWSQVTPNAEEKMIHVVNVMVFGVPVLFVLLLFWGFRKRGRNPVSYNEQKNLMRENDGAKEPEDNGDYD